MARKKLVMMFLTFILKEMVPIIHFSVLTSQEQKQGV